MSERGQSKFVGRHRVLKLAGEVGVEPTKNAWRLPTDLKSARPTGVRFSPVTMLTCQAALSKSLRRHDDTRGLVHPSLIAESLRETDPVEILQQFDGDIASEAGTVAERRRVE